MKLGLSMFAGDEGKSGISEYMRQIVNGLLDQSPDMHLVLFMSHSDRKHFDPKHERATVITYEDFWGHPLLSILWHFVLLPVALRKFACEAVFLPAANRRLGFFYGVPSVGTVHDFSQLHVPAKYDRFRTFYTMRILPALMRRLDRVIAISESTKIDLIDFARVNPARVDLVYNGASLSNSYVADAEQVVDATACAEFLGTGGQPYLLYVARIEHPGKNHIALLEAFALMKQNYALPHKLVCVGEKWNGAQVIENRIADLGLSTEVVLTGFAPKELLPEIYRSADLFVFPSLFEGFGIPVLEAMAAGTPVCASNRSSIPEIVGDAGLLFDPEVPEDIARCVLSLLRKPSLKRELESRGHIRVRDFSWNQSASGVLRSIKASLSNLHNKELGLLPEKEGR